MSVYKPAKHVAVIAVIWLFVSFPAFAEQDALAEIAQRTQELESRVRCTAQGNLISCFEALGLSCKPTGETPKVFVCSSSGKSVYTLREASPGNWVVEVEPGLDMRKFEDNDR